MFIGRMGRALCVIVEPACRADLAEGEDADSLPEKGPWLDHWVGSQGHFFRVGRVLLIYTPRALRRAGAGAG
jgi:hypothetical protein